MARHVVGTLEQQIQLLLQCEADDEVWRDEVSHEVYVGSDIDNNEDFVNMLYVGTVAAYREALQTLIEAR